MFRVYGEGEGEPQVPPTAVSLPNRNKGVSLIVYMPNDVDLYSLATSYKLYDNLYRNISIGVT